MKYYLIIMFFMLNSLVLLSNDNEDVPPSSDFTKIDNNAPVAPDGLNEAVPPLKNTKRKQVNNKKSLYKKAKRYLYKRKFKKAVYFLKKSCNLNYAQACFDLGKIYRFDKLQRGKIIFKRDINLFNKYHKKACNLKYAESCVKLYDYLRRQKHYIRKNNKLIKDKNKDIAIYLEKACKYGDKYSCKTIQRNKERILRKEKREKEKEEQLKKLEKSCKAGRKSSCQKLAMKIFFKASNYFHRKDYENASLAFKKSCKLGLSKSCRYLGLINLKKGNFTEAKKYIDNTCKLGDNIACEMNKIIKNKENCEKDNAIACRKLAKLNFEYITRDYSILIKYYKKACLLKDAISCKTIADHFYGPYNRNLDLAYDFYKKACALKDEKSCQTSKILELDKKCGLGNALICDKLGNMYDIGKNVKRDTSKANEYFQKACKLGNKISCDK